MKKSELLAGAAITAMAAFCLPATAQEVEDEVSVQDTIVVTGSNIKRSDFNDSGSPITLFDEEELKLQAPGGKISDVVRYLPSNYGAFGTGTTSEPENRFGGSSINLRGLGAGATLVLVNGRRQTRQPFAQDGRVDVNSLVPSIMIERIEVLQDGASSIYGTDAVAGVANFITKDDYDGLLLDVKHRGQVDGYTYKETSLGVLGGTEVGSKGHAVVAFEYVNIDPLQFADLEFDPLLTEGGSAFGQPGNYGVPVRDDNGILVRNAGGVITRQTTADPACQDVIDLGPDVAGSVFFRPNSNGGRGQCRLGILQSLDAVLAEERWNAGATYTHQFDNDINFRGEFAFSRTQAVNRGNTTTPVSVSPLVPGDNPGNPFRAVDGLGNELFAADANSDGIPDRDSNGDVILAALPTDPSSGIPFNEDVTGFFRPFGDVGGAPGAINTPQRQENRTMRLSGVLDGPVSGSDSWTWETGWTYSQTDLDFRFSDSDRSNLVEALNCEGGAGGTECFNPFGSRYFASAGDAEFNTESVNNSIKYVAHDQYESELWSLDALLTGDLFELPAGTVGTAFGAQYRKETLTYDYDGLKSANQLSFSGRGDQDFSADRDVWAIYGEALVPVLSGESGDLDLSVAVRYESDDNNETFNPKISGVYTKGWFTGRASYSTSFLAPSLFQTDGNIVLRQRVTDPISGIVNENINTTIVGNPDLDPQDSTAYNIGFTAEPVDGLSFGVDYWTFEFEDLLATPSASGIVSADPNDPRIIRDPNTNQIITVQRPFFNASQVDVSGVDFTLDYEHGLGAGTATFDVNGTWISKYDLQATTTSSVIDGIGFENDGNFGTTLPEYKVFGRAGYEIGNHGAFLTARWYSEIEQEDGIETEAPVFLDFLYTYALEERGLSFQAGLLNIGDSIDPIIQESNLFVETVQDPIGRRFFVGVSKEF